MRREMLSAIRSEGGLLPSELLSPIIWLNTRKSTSQLAVRGAVCWEPGSRLKTSWKTLMSKTRARPKLASVGSIWFSKNWATGAWRRPVGLRLRIKITQFLIFGKTHPCIFWAPAFPWTGALKVWLGQL